MKPGLIKNIDEVRPNLPVAFTCTFLQLQPFLYSAERAFIKLMIGSGQYDALVTAYQAGTVDEELKAAIALAQRIICGLGFLEGLPVLSVSITGAGIQINSTDQVKNAFQWQVEDIKDSLQELGFSAIEEFLEYIEERPEKFTEYQESEEFAARKASLIRSAADFDKNYDINRSRFVFQRLFAIMRRVETQTLIRLMGANFYSTLLADNLSGKKLELVENYLKPGLALLTVSKAMVERVITLEGGKVAFNFKGSYNNMKESMAATRDQIEELRKDLEKDGSDFISTGLELITANLSEFSGYEPPAQRSRARFKNSKENGVFGI